MTNRNIISERRVILNTIYNWTFSHRNGRRAFSFACDINGNLILSKELDEKGYVDTIIHNIVKCIQREEPPFDTLIDEGICKREYMEVQPAVLKCYCGEEVELSSFTNTCTCGTDYNMSGQQLADRSQWGCETGETADEILSYDYKNKPEIDY